MNKTEIINTCEMRVQQVLNDDILSRYDVRPKAEIIRELRRQRDETLRELNRSYD